MPTCSWKHLHWGHVNEMPWAPFLITAEQRPAFCIVSSKPAWPPDCPCSCSLGCLAKMLDAIADDGFKLPEASLQHRMGFGLINSLLNFCRQR